MINTDRIVTHEPRCATGPWNYDMDAAPRDGTHIMLAWQYEGEVHAGCFYYDNDGIGDYVWWSGGDFLYEAEPFAWAAINLPEVPK